MIIPRHVLGGPEAPSNRLRMGSIGVGRMEKGDMGAAMKVGRKLTWDPQAERFSGDDEANTMLDYPHRKGWEV
jgi:hypothetical protein